MRNPLIRLSGMMLACCAAVFGHPAAATAQTVADNSATQRETPPSYTATAGSATSSAALARSYTVTREFNTTDDHATIDVLKGTVNYQIYIRTSPDMPWKLVESKTGIRPADATSVRVSYPDSYELKVMLTTECRECVEVRFDQ